MSTNVVKVNGDYKIKSVQGGTITLDAGSTGNVKVTGKLTVEGETVTVTTVNMEVKDNVILLNREEAGNKITAGYSGIEISRGSNANGNGQIFFTENIDWTDTGNSTKSGLFVFKTQNTGICAIRTNCINTGGNNLYLINSAGTGVITVAGTTNYEVNVLDDDHIPNKKYVDDKVGSAARLTIANNKTLTVNNSLVFSGTESASVNFGNGGSVAYRGVSLVQFTEGGTSSADLIKIMNDETGDGKLVFNNNPTFTGNNITIQGVTTSGTPYGTGRLIFSNSPEITTPKIIAPANGIGVNVTAIVSGVTGQSGTPNLVFSNSPTIVTPVITGNLTIQGVVTTGATGNQRMVFDNSPTLITPTLGVASATSINKVTITAPATAATITIANNKTLIVNNTLTFTGTDTSSVNFGNGGTVVYLGSPINNQSSGYPLDLTDQNKTIYTNSDLTIPSNTSVPFPIGTTIDIISRDIIFVYIDGGDTLQWGGQASNLTGPRTIAKYGMARLIKVTSTIWYISGQGIT